MTFGAGQEIAVTPFPYLQSRDCYYCAHPLLAECVFITSCMWCGSSSLNRAMVLRIFPYHEPGCPIPPDFLWGLARMDELHAVFLKNRTGGTGWGCVQEIRCLARFSRDGGFHCTPTGIPPGLKGRPTVAPHISRKTSEIWGTRVRGRAIVGRFLHRGINVHLCDALH